MGRRESFNYSAVRNLYVWILIQNPTEVKCSTYFDPVRLHNYYRPQVKIAEDWRYETLYEKLDEF